MKKVSYQQFKKDYCKNCVYNKICSVDMKRECIQEDKKILNNLATMIYRESTIVVENIRSNG